MGVRASIDVTEGPRPGTRTRARAVAVLVWAVWAAVTLSTILYIRHYSRNIPFYDDFTVVPVMTGHEPLSYRWATAQFNEHRNVIPRLTQAILLRAIPDFRAMLYFNAGLLATAAASAILLARHLRGRTHLLDAVLPLSILTIGQCESLLLGFCSTLAMTAWLGWRLIGIMSRSAEPPGAWSCLRIGVALGLMPLCGGGGMAMLPPLILWLFGYVAAGWWSGRDPGSRVRAIGLALLTTTSATIAWYLVGYVRPAHIPPPPSAWAVGATTLEVCGLVIEPVGWTHWPSAGLAVALLAAATLVLLAATAWRSPRERPRALGLFAILSSIMLIALSIGYSRSGLGPGNGWCSRYITAAMPMLGVVYFAWLIYGPTSARRAVHVALLIVVSAGIPAQVQFAHAVGAGRHGLYRRVEAGLERGLPRSRVVELAYPHLLPDRARLGEYFQMLKEARVGKFRNMADDHVATRPDAGRRAR
jgi:hypothetical protein